MVAFIFISALLIAVPHSLTLARKLEMLGIRAPFTNTDECAFFFLQFVLKIWDSNFAEDNCIFRHLAFKS